MRVGRYQGKSRGHQWPTVPLTAWLKSFAFSQTSNKRCSCKEVGFGVRLPTDKSKYPSAPDPLPVRTSAAPRSIALPEEPAEAEQGVQPQPPCTLALDPGIPPSENVSLYLTKKNHRFSNAGNKLRCLRTVWPKYLHLSITSWNKVTRTGTAQKAGGNFITRGQVWRGVMLPVEGRYV